MIKRVVAFALMLTFSLFNTGAVAFAGSYDDDVRIEHLPSIEGAKVNLVKVSDTGSIIQRENMLEIAFAENFNSKYYKPGDFVQFNFNCDVKTTEGTLLIPCNSSLIAKIRSIEKPKWFSRNAKVCLEFTHILFPDGTNIPVCLELANKKGYLGYGAKQTAGKIIAYTLIIGGSWAGIGAAIGTASNNTIPGLIIGGSVGGGVGLLSGIVSPGLHYKAKKGQTIPIRLQENITVPCM